MITSKSKLFLVTRADLPPGQQTVQPAHALDEFIVEWPDEHRVWHKISKNLAVLTVQDERELQALWAEAHGRGLPCSSFCEPDRDGELTAIAIGPGPVAKRLTRSLPLALAS